MNLSLFRVICGLSNSLTRFTFRSTFSILLVDLAIDLKFSHLPGPYSKNKDVNASIITITIRIIIKV